MVSAGVLFWNREGWLLRMIEVSEKLEELVFYHNLCIITVPLHISLKKETMVRLTNFSNAMLTNVN